MKLFAVDVETTGLDPSVHAIIEIAIVQFDSQGSGAEKWWHRYTIPDYLNWTEYCLKLHAQTIQDLIKGTIPRIANDREFGKYPVAYAMDVGLLVKDLRWWMRENNLFNKEDGTYPKLVACGKNFSSFDKAFIDQDLDSNIFKHRALDPTFWFTRHTDLVPPELAECKKRAAEEGCKFAFSEVRHNAIDDAMDIVFLMQHVMQKRDNFYEEYKREKYTGLAS